MGEMGAALVRGIQHHVMACPKHFALKSMENGRFKVDVAADARTMDEVYLPHFKRVVKEGAASLMSAYNSLNGEWASQNEALLTDILQQQWGFQGFVQSDWGFAVRDARKAALAGQHVEMPFRNVYYRFLPDLIKNGEVPAELVDDAALRFLRQLVKFGQGRDPRDYPPDVIGCEAHRRLAREAAQKSIVLLKNEGHVLPLRGVRDVAVLGRLADMPNIGDHGSSTANPPMWSRRCKAFLRRSARPSASSMRRGAIPHARPRRPGSATWRSSWSATPGVTRVNSCPGVRGRGPPTSPRSPSRPRTSRRPARWRR